MIFPPSSFWTAEEGRVVGAGQERFNLRKRRRRREKSWRRGKAHKSNKEEGGEKGGKWAHRSREKEIGRRRRRTRAVHNDAERGG